MFAGCVPRVRRLALASALAAASLCIVAPASHANVVTDWNVTALDTLTSNNWPMARVARALAITQIAVADALAAIDCGYAPYVAGLPPTPGASAPAAASQAAAHVLKALAPNHTAQLDAANTAVLATIAPSPAKTAGIALGDAAAENILSARRGDGADWSTDYKPGMGPGVYRPTSDEAMQTPHIGRMRPFVLDRMDGLRPPPPPFGSAQYTRDLAEVEALGSIDSTLRMPEQTRIAKFHEPFGYIPWNAIARSVIAARALSLPESARVLALLNVALSDAHSAGLEAKYAYNLWRPTTAARESGHPGWTAAIPVPMHPEYVCVHCIAGSAGQAVMEAAFGDGPVAFSVTSVATRETRQYRHFRQFAEEEAMSRIYAGVHFRWSMIVGAAMGKQIGELAVAKDFTPDR